MPCSRRGMPDWSVWIVGICCFGSGQLTFVDLVFRWTKMFVSFSLLGILVLVLLFFHNILDLGLPGMKHA